MATWKTHNVQLANFDVTSFACHLVLFGRALGCLFGQHLMLRKHSRDAKVVSRNEWRTLWTHRLSGHDAAAAAFSHVVRNGTAGSHVVRATSSTTVSSDLQARKRSGITKNDGSILSPESRLATAIREMKLWRDCRVVVVNFPCQCFPTNSYDVISRSVLRRPAATVINFHPATGQTTSGKCR